MEKELGILYSIHKEHTEKIFLGLKPFEFRKSLPKDFGVGKKIYIYETSKSGGCKKVVGEAIVSDYFYLLDKDGKWPCYGPYNFIEYYLEKVKGDSETADRYKRVKNEFADKFEKYKYGFIIQYALCDEELENIRKTGSPIDTWKLVGTYSSNLLLSKILNDIERSNKIIQECDEWLEKQGFYNEYCESYWKYAIELSNIKKYDKPILLSEFNDKNGNPIKRAPQGWMYCKVKNM